MSVLDPTEFDAEMGRVGALAWELFSNNHATALSSVMES